MTISGGSSHGFLMGDGSNDRLYGDSGNDRLCGNSGADYLNGGTNSDACRGVGALILGRNVRTMHLISQSCRFFLEQLLSR